MNVLLYVNKSKKPNEVGWLDCLKYPPKPLEGKIPIKLEHDSISDMCFVNYRKQELLVYTCHSGVFAQSIKSSKNVWSITETSMGALKDPSSVTADDHGHIFVSDPNNSIVLMFSFDGVELCTAMNLTDMGKLGPICWCESEKSLLVSCEIGYYWSIFVVKLKDTL